MTAWWNFNQPKPGDKNREPLLGEFFAFELFSTPSERHAEVDTSPPPVTASRSPRRLGSTRAPRFLSDDERGAYNLRPPASRRKGQEAPLVAVFN